MHEGSSKCRDGYYYDVYLKRCRRCSISCAEEHIVLPCSEFSNVICEVPPPSGDIYSTELFGDGYHHPGSDNPGVHVAKSSGIPHSRNRGEAGVEGEQGLTMEEKHSWKNWETLAFVLKAFLCLLIVVALVVGIVAWFKVQQALKLKQNVEPDIDDADSGYVVIRTIRDGAGPWTAFSDGSLYSREERLAHPPLLASRDTGLGSSDAPSSFSSPGQPRCFLPRVYTPQRRLLSYDADDVFESDDQAPQQTLYPRPEAFAAKRSLFNDLRSQKNKSRKKRRKALKSLEKNSSSLNVGCFGKIPKEQSKGRVDFV